MSMKSSLIATLAFMFANNGSRRMSLPVVELTKEEIKEVESYRASREEQRKKKAGMREYSFNGVSVWALNRKNAVRKLKAILEHSSVDLPQPIKKPQHIVFREKRSLKARFNVLMGRYERIGS